MSRGALSESFDGLRTSGEVLEMIEISPLMLSLSKHDSAPFSGLLVM
jgi:hypothetical protein